MDRMAKAKKKAASRMPGDFTPITFLDKPQTLLTVELVPQSSWGDNVRSLVAPDKWDELRRACYRAAGWCCEVCGEGNQPPHCHEVWRYDDASHVQRLVRLITLCPDCHEVKHIGRARVMGRIEPALAHLAAVNGWSRAEAQRHVDDAFAVWRSRSEHPWTVDTSILGVEHARPPKKLTKATPRRKAAKSKPIAKAKGRKAGRK